MVKIPELPGGYRAGDVVNGHVLTDRGHWVPVEEADRWGVRPRRGAPPQAAPVPAIDGPATSRYASPAPQPDAATAPPAGGPTTPPPTVRPAPRQRSGQRSAASRLVSLAIFAFVLFFGARIFQSVGSAIDDFSFFEENDGGEEVIWETTAAEPEETWWDEGDGPFPADVLAIEPWTTDTLGVRPVVVLENGNGPTSWLWVTFELEAVDAAGDVVATGYGAAEIPPQARAAELIYFSDDDVGSDFTFHFRPVMAVQTRGGAGQFTASDLRIENEFGFATVTGTLRSTFDAAADYLEVTVLIRDGAGALVDIAEAVVIDVAAGDDTEFVAYTFSGREPADGDTAEAFFSR